MTRYLTQALDVLREAECARNAIEVVVVVVVVVAMVVVVAVVVGVVIIFSWIQDVYYQFGRSYRWMLTGCLTDVGVRNCPNVKLFT